MLLDTALALTADRQRLLPASARRVVAKLTHAGGVPTVGELLSALSASDRALVVEVLTPPPPGVADLYPLSANDLLTSVGLEPSPGTGWYPVSMTLQGDSPCPPPVRERIREALRIRSERRARGAALERELGKALDVPLPAPLGPLVQRLAEARDALRARLVPEHEFDVLTRWSLDEAVGAVRWSNGSLAVEVGVLDDLELPAAPNRWYLAAVDRTLHALTVDGHPLREALIRIHARPRWERELERLDASLAKAPTAELGFRFIRSDYGEWSIRPVSCTARARSVQLKTLKLSELRGFRQAPAEARTLSLMSGWRGGLPPEIVAAVAEGLIGHPRLFSGSKGSKPLSVRRRSMSLHLAVVGGAVRPALTIDGDPVEPPDRWEIGDVATWLRLVERPDADELQLVALPSEIDALSAWLGRTGELPLDALPALVQRIPALTGQLPVALDPSLRGEPLPADLRPVVRVGWDGRGLTLDVHLRHLPELPPVAPGHGLPELVTSRDGKAYHVPRDLDAEPSQVEAALAPLELPEADREGWRWTIDGRERALTTLAALSEHGAGLHTAWDGPPPTFHRATTRAVKVRVRSGAGWFAVEGDASFGKDRVPLDAILQAIRDGSSFVEVRAGVFAQIARGLRDALAPVAAAEDDGKLSVVHAPALDALAAAEVAVEADAPFRASLDHLRASASLDVPLPEGFTAELRPYQRAGFTWLARLATWAPGAVLADDMGLGKTVQAIALLCRRGDHGPALVVAPLSVNPNWEAELARFAPELEVVRYRGGDRSARLDAAGPRQVVLTTWDLLARDAPLRAVRWGTVVLDEAQAIKNAGTARAKAAAELQHGFLVALSGTPVENRSEELWSLASVVVPGLLGGQRRFATRFADPIAAGVPGAREALAQLLRPFVLRRTKAQVAQDLPARTEVVIRVPLSPDEVALYERTRLEAIVRTSEKGPSGRGFEALRWLTRLRQLACNPRLVDETSPIASSKLETLRRRVADLRASGQRALVFSQFVRHLELARDALAVDGVSYRWLTGDTSERDRRREVEAFQSGAADVFLISLGAGGTGLNLTAATYVFHLDPWWNPAKEDQASDRAHRIGQREPVTIYRLVAEGTIEEKILTLHAEKRELADALLAGTDAADRLTADELVSLLADNGPVAPRAPDPPPAAAPEPTDWVERYRRHLEQQLAAGVLKTPKVAREYERAVQRMLAWAGQPTTADAVVAAAERWVVAVTDGTTGTRTDQVFGRPAVRRLAALLTEPPG